MNHRMKFSLLSFSFPRMHGQRVYAHPSEYSVSPLWTLIHTNPWLVDLRRKQHRSEKWPRFNEIPVGVVNRFYQCPFWRWNRNDLGPNQACTLFGSEGGSPIINGASYLSVGYGYEVADLWRLDFLVLVGFVLLFQITQILALEYYPVSGMFYIVSIVY